MLSFSLTEKVSNNKREFLLPMVLTIRVPKMPICQENFQAL